MLDFADVFKIAPTLQQKRLPALTEAPPIRLLRLAEPNCKKQQVAGPSGSETPVPGKAQSNAKEQEQERSTKDVATMFQQSPCEVSTKHIYTYFPGEYPREAEEKDRSCHPGEPWDIKAQDAKNSVLL